MPSLTPASVLRRILPMPTWLPAVLVIMGLAACADARADVAVTPAPFGGAVLNQAGPDYDFSFNASFEPDGNRIFFSRAKKDWSKIQLFTAQRTADGWSAPTPMVLGDADARNTDPQVSPDGRLLYFASDRAVPGQPAKPGDYHLWVARKQGARWGEPEPLAGDVGAALAPSMTLGGDLYFMHQDGKEMAGLYLAHIRAGQALDPAPLAIPGAAAGQDAAVSRDGKLLVFVAPDTGGSKAIFLARHDKAGWSAPEKLKLGEGFGNPFALGLAPDGQTLYFTAARSGAAPQIFAASLPAADMAG